MFVFSIYFWDVVLSNSTEPIIGFVHKIVGPGGGGSQAKGGCTILETGMRQKQALKQPLVPFSQ